MCQSCSTVIASSVLKYTSRFLSGYSGGLNTMLALISHTPVNLR